MTEMTTTNIVYISAEAIVGAITVVGNLIVLIAILRTPRLHTITNVFIGNLAMADIAVGVFVAPSAALSYLGLPHNVYGCIFINCTILMFTNISILMLLTIAIERFLAIRFPFVYERNVTIKTAVWTNVSIWILGSVLGLLPMYGWNKAPDDISFCAFTGVITMEYMVYFQFFGLVLVPLLIMFCVYLHILFIVRHHIKQTRALQNMFQNQQNNSRRSRRFDKDVRAAKLFALLFFLFGIFWLPINIMNSITLFCPSCYSPFELLLVTIVLSHANSSINPFLYAASNSRIKDAIKSLFRMKLSPEEIESLNRNKTRDNENSSLQNDLNSRSALKNTMERHSFGDDGIPENENNVHTISSYQANDKNMNSFTSGNVSFMMTPDVLEQKAPHILEQRQDIHFPQNSSQPASSLNGQNFEVESNGKKQTHFLKDELDKLDRLVPVDGIMANIYDSIDDDTRDIILGKSEKLNQEPKHNLSNSSNSRNGSQEVQISSHNMAGYQGHTNPAFVDDEIKDDLPKDISKDKHFPGSKVNDTVALVHPQVTKPHLFSNLRINEPIPTAIFGRSPNLLSGDNPSFSISQDSTVNLPSDNNFSVSTIASDMQIPRLSTNNSSELPLATPLTDPYTMELPSHVISPTLAETPYMTRHLIVMESEMDDDIMSVKRFQESPEMESTISHSQQVFDERGILKNNFTQRTKL